MVTRIPSATLVGVEARSVDVEVHVARGLPSMTIVGLPDAAVREARERVRAALLSSGFDVPRARILVNLAPADLRKEGPALDLPIALALLAADGRLPLESAGATLAVGELALDGSLRSLRGAVAIGLLAVQRRVARVLLPTPDAPAVHALDGPIVLPVASLADAVALLRGRSAPAFVGSRPAATPDPPPLDLRDVRGQPTARLGLEIAAAGGHALLMTGPPGSGKTMLARRLPGLLPDLDREARIEVTRIHSAAGEPLAGGSDGLLRRPPFRAPHHATSRVALLGGGRHPRPGEVSLAHRGVLFLDELPEFARATLEALRQPLEEGVVTIERHAARMRLPAAFQLVAARNPCPCGAYGDPRGTCRCRESERHRYQARLSGPILDRIDLHVAVPLLTPEELAGGDGEASSDVAARVLGARGRALARQRTSNARLDDAELARACALDAQDRARAARMAGELGLSARGHARLLRVARTVADLAGVERVGPDQLAVAATFRSPARRPP